MKSSAAFAILFAPCVLGAQQINLPPSSVQDGVIIQSAGINAGTNYWGASKSLAAYRFSGDGYQNPIRPNKADSQLGLKWTTTAPDSLNTAKQDLNATGGIIRVIFLGETAGWLNDFGYTYSGTPEGPTSYTAWTNIQAAGCNPNIKFGDYFNINFDPGQLSNFDFWFSASGSSSTHPTSLTAQGGVYTFFNPQNGSTNTQQLLWSANSIAVNTWIPSLSASEPVATYLVGIEDWRIDRCADRDCNDFVVAIQFLDADGSAIAAVPEPGTWAFIAGALAFGCVLFSRTHLPNLCKPLEKRGVK